MTKVLAKITNPALPPTLGEGDVSQGGTIIGELISNIVGALFIIAILFTLAYLVTGGIQWITSGGDKNQLEQARNKITNALIGLIIVGSSYAIFMLIGQFFGLNLPSITIPSFGGNAN